MGMVRMTKRQVCEAYKPFAYYSGFGGVELHYIEYGIKDYIYCTSNAWYSVKSYHKLKVYYDSNNSYIMLKGYKIPFDECIRIGE